MKRYLVVVTFQVRAESPAAAQRQLAGFLAGFFAPWRCAYRPGWPWLRSWAVAPSPIEIEDVDEKP